MPYHNSSPQSHCRILLALILLALAALPAQAAPAGPDAVTISKVFVTGVRDTRFTVSWATDVAADSYVDWGTTTALGSTTADAVASARTHVVFVPDDPAALTASTTYYFRVRSGGATDDNAGDLYSVTTGPTLGIPPTGKTVWGYVYQAGGVTPAADVPVYLRLEDNNGAGSAGASQWVTARSDSSGVWYLSLNNVRTASAAGYFTFSDGADKLRLIARGAALGAAELNPATPATYTSGAAQVANLILTAPAAPVAPVVTAAVVNTTSLRLTWPPQVADYDYEVWRSATPYVAPKAAGSHRCAEFTLPYPTATLAFTDTNTVGNPTANWFYVVRGYDLGGTLAADSVAQGVFSFALTPGSQ
jgi:hypothetical protein